MVTSATSSSASPSRSTPASSSSRAITASRELALAGEVPVDRPLVDAGARRRRARTVSARQFQIGEAVEQLGAGGDDALARLAPRAGGGAGCRTGGAVRVGVTLTAVTTGSVSQPRTVDVGASLAPSRVDVPLGEPLQHLFERDAALEPGQRGAEAEVDAVAEREVLADLAVDVEPVAVGVAPVVAVRRRRRGTA